MRKLTIIAEIEVADNCDDEFVENYAADSIGTMKGCYPPYHPIQGSELVSVKVKRKKGTKKALPFNYDQAAQDFHDEEERRYREKHWPSRQKKAKKKPKKKVKRHVKV